MQSKGDEGMLKDEVTLTKKRLILGLVLIFIAGLLIGFSMR
jgi:hypothetical protein